MVPNLETQSYDQMHLQTVLAVDMHLASLMEVLFDDFAAEAAAERVVSVAAVAAAAAAVASVVVVVVVVVAAVAAIVVAGLQKMELDCCSTGLDHDFGSHTDSHSSAVAYLRYRIHCG
jgi:hypothetical protein